MFLMLIVALASFAIAFLSVPVLIRKFARACIIGRDMHKAGKPEIPEMGGLAVVAGFVAGVLVAIAMITLMHSRLIGDSSFPVFSSLIEIFAALVTILIITLIGVFDDLVSMRQSVKAFLPVVAALPLVAVAAGHPYLSIPFLGTLYLPLIYPLILIPMAVTAAANMTNMLAGYNGLEAGMGLMACSSLAVIALSKGRLDGAVLLVAMSAALFAFLMFNRYPARILPGDAGTLSIGACIASALIIGNFESAGIVMLPYLADFFIKAKNRFPKELDYVKLKNGRLVARKAVGLPSLILRMRSMAETQLVMLLVGIQAFAGAIAVLIL
jgi:UDP-N-acetylglucosamine--dolichyl-phosphate N-acetylglucosaminephosphotransferase